MDPLGVARMLKEMAHQKMLLAIQKYNQVKQLEMVHGSSAEIEQELARLISKIKKYSDVQKKFKQEVNRKYSEIYGKPQQSQRRLSISKHRTEITKEMFLSHLGLVTREALAKLQTKSKERKRRSTANPNFSHEAIQAKRIVEERNRQMKSRQLKEDKLRGVSLLKSTRQQARAQLSPSTNNSGNSSSNNNNSNKVTQQQIRQTQLQQQRHQQMIEQERNKRDLIINEERELLAQKYTLINRIAELQAGLETKQAIKEEINKENEKIKKRVSDIISTVNLFSAKILFQDDIDLEHSVDLRCDEQLDSIF